MSIDFYSNQPGAVVAVPSPGVPATLFGVGGPVFPWLGYPIFKACFTGWSWTGESGMAAMHSMRDLIYIYTIGERLMSLTLQGYAFGQVCENTADRIQDEYGRTRFAYPQVHGFEIVQQYYELNRIGTSGQACMLTFGLATVFPGFLRGIQITSADWTLPMVNFTLRFDALPRKTYLDSVLG